MVTLTLQSLLEVHQDGIFLMALMLSHLSHHSGMIPTETDMETMPLGSNQMIVQVLKVILILIYSVAQMQIMMEHPKEMMLSPVILHNGKIPMVMDTEIILMALTLMPVLQ